MTDPGSIELRPKIYVGRFAPSPSGPLHFGSLVCALASYLDAKSHDGRWLLRIEDIDPPREQPGAADAIKRTLQAHELLWDGDVIYQSERTEAYQTVLQELERADLIYRCDCTRKRLTPLHGRYDGHCRHNPPPALKPAALRLKVSELPEPFSHLSSYTSFRDRVRGLQQEAIEQVSGDFVVHRKDGLYAYQLAVVVDDINQGITDVVRGDDLLDTTAKQIYLYRLLGAPPPSFAHIPVIRDSRGHKLSKQNHAPAVDDTQALANLRSALLALGISPPEGSTIREAITYGIDHFRLGRGNTYP